MGNNPRSSNVRLQSERWGEDDVVAPPASDDSLDIVVAPCDHVVMLNSGIVLHGGEV